MGSGNLIVLDVGKTLTKLTVWQPDGVLIERRTYANQTARTSSYIALDAVGITRWLETTLARFAARGPVAGIIPVGHGAGAALVRDGALCLPPVDYEHAWPEKLLVEYTKLRDGFSVTGSPALPNGLNLGAQLYCLEKSQADIFDGATILPWAQYWSWLLSGVATSEVSSLGCHTDTWCPEAAEFSPLAKQRGWADKFAPIASAGDAIGTLTADWAARTGLSTQVQIYCGAHDSNAALVAARAFAEIANAEATVLSTGTWFVAMRSPAGMFDLGHLPEARDCLVNVDVNGRAVPSARFMGGREIEALIGSETRRVDIKADQTALLAAVPGLVADGAMLTPCFAPGFGPFASHEGRWVREPADWISRRATICLYAALVCDVSLDLIGAKNILLVEGRFAQAEVFVRALSRLRPATKVYTSSAENDVSFGALRLVTPAVMPSAKLVPVAPLEMDLSSYKAAWHKEVGI